MKKFNEDKPFNMTQVLIKWADSQRLDFAYYKDGLFLVDDEWYSPKEIESWISTEDLKKLLEI